MDYEKDVDDDAESLLTDNDEVVKAALREDGKFYDIEDLEDRIHEQVTDKAYCAEDALYIIRNCKNEETDRGLWEGV